RDGAAGRRVDDAGARQRRHHSRRVQLIMGERGRSSARDRLLGRKIPPVEVTIRADFSPESDAAQAEVEAAQRALAEAQARGADLTSAQLRLNIAKDAMRPYVEVLQAVPLPPAEYEALIDAHPPREHEQVRG